MFAKKKKSASLPAVVSFETFESRRLMSFGGPHGGIIELHPHAGQETGQHESGRHGSVDHSGERSASPVIGAAIGRHHGSDGVAHVKPDFTDPIIVADIAQIKEDEQAYHDKFDELRDTLKADRQAVVEAVKALDDQIKPLVEKYKSDALGFGQTLLADSKAVFEARRAGDVDAATTATQKYKTDLAEARTALKADSTAVKTLISQDPAVIAAKAKFDDDAAPLKEIMVTIKADYAQLRTDLAAQQSVTDPTTPDDSSSSSDQDMGSAAA